MVDGLRLSAYHCQPRQALPGRYSQAIAGTKGRKGYTSATGELFKNEGEFTIPCRTQEGHQRTVTFQHSSKVSLPILSTGGLTDLDNDVMYRKHDGYIEYIPTGEKSYFFKLHGVYFVKMKIPMWVLNKTDHPPPMDFRRPGTPWSLMMIP